MTEQETPVVAKEASEKAEATSTETSQASTDRRDRRRGGSTGGARGRGRGRRRGAREPKEFEESILQIDRVTRVTRGGRQLRFRVSVVIGDKKGRVGFGIGKSSEVVGAIRKGIAQAKKNLINVPIFNGTIPHDVKFKFKSSQVSLFPAPEGKGVIAGGAVRKVLELSGVKDVLSKIHGSRNKLNTAHSTLEALKMLATKPRVEKKKAEEAPAVAEEKPKAKKTKKAEPVTDQAS